MGKFAKKTSEIRERHLNAFGTDNYRDTPCSLRCAQPQPTLAMQLRVIVYNKTRKLCGHEFFIEHDGTNSQWVCFQVKRIIEEKTTVPHQIQWIVFGVRNLRDTDRLSDYAIRDGYTIYSVPTYVEIPSIPNL
ncbi:hypothetical protein ANCCEY_09981 [Ancylostoma ceylanicum]|uniref:Ubiquitin-like domain-containing protein n=1 Tax=Ancylostoma ceylanicum TaxID=53326 RepID=A0A0D6LG34_9BILA|nr:hypothetical protein ANCCEY_09981 [Ancylostoma ceylanicum]